MGISIVASALPLHLTTHLRNVTPQDCERVIAKIAETESKDRNIKNHMDEVPQCITFFTQRLTRESFHDKDYRKGCQGLLPDFCQQNRYLSLQTIVEKYKTNRLKLIGTMGLGFMYGRNAITEVKRVADRFKKSTGKNAKTTKSQGEVRYEENKKLVEECPKRDPEGCKLTWKIKDPTCLDETKRSKTKCECVPATWTDDYDPATGQCGKHRTECLANNGQNKKPLEPRSYFGTTFNTARATNQDLNIIEWAYDNTDDSHGVKGCYIKQCADGYDRDEYHLKCNIQQTPINGETPEIPPEDDEGPEEGTPEYICAQKAKTETVEKWQYIASSTQCTGDPEGCVVDECKSGTYPAPDLVSCIAATDPNEETCLKRNLQVGLYPNVCGWSYSIIGDEDVKGTCFPDRCKSGTKMRKWLVDCDGRTNEACVFHCSTKTYPGTLENFYMNTIKDYCTFDGWDGDYDEDCTGENRDTCNINDCNFLGD